MFFNQGGRHLWFAQELKRKGYNPIIMCASTTHNSKGVPSQMELYKVRYFDDIPFVFIKCNDYKSNNGKRIFNMLAFYRGLLKLRKEFKNINIDSPDIIYGSSVHPLTLVAGIKLANFFDIESISEVRDLWPESIVAYSSIKKNNLIIQGLYKGEKWIYEKSDKLIMTWEGGYKYIQDKEWNKIPKNKVTHINNGVVLENFDFNTNNNVFISDYLNDKNYVNIVYTGSIRKVNNIDFLLNIAKELDKQQDNNIRILIFGSGNYVEHIIKRIHEERINSAIYMGSVEKKYIPSIISQSTINILHNKSTILDQYGQSQNKLFEYLAAGKPILQTYSTEFSIVENYSCGLMCENQTIENNIRNIQEILIEKNYLYMSKQSRIAAEKYDYKELTKCLISVIEK